MRRVFYRPLAHSDLESLYLYLHARSEKAADAYVGDVLEAIWRLAEHPASSPARLDRFPDVRIATVRNHLILYKALPDDAEIDILRVVHGAQNWSDDVAFDPETE